MSNIKCAFTSLGLIIGEFVNNEDGSTTIINPRTITPNENGDISLTNFIMLFDEKEVTFEKSDFSVKPLTPREDLVKFYLREFSTGVDLIVPEKKIITTK